MEKIFRSHTQVLTLKFYQVLGTNSHIYLDRLRLLLLENRGKVRGQGVNSSTQNRHTDACWLLHVGELQDMNYEMATTLRTGTNSII